MECKVSNRLQPKFLIIMIIFINIAYQFQIVSQVHTPNCSQPLLKQYINSSSLPSNDLRDIIRIQIPRPLLLKNISNSHLQTTFSDIYYQPEYLGQDKKVQIQGDLEIVIKNDSLKNKITLTAQISKIVGKNKYQIVINSGEVFMNYEKMYDQLTNKFQLKNFEIVYTPEWLKNVQIQPQPKKQEDTNKILSLINNQLQIQLKKQINTIKLWMIDHANNSNIGAIYPQGMYEYNFYDFQELIDMNSISIKTESGQTSIMFQNGIRGSIQNVPIKYCPSQKQTKMQGFSQFITFEFIQNLASTENIKKYGNWQNININRTWVCTQNFQWKLVDLQFLVPQIVQEYGKYYMNDIRFICHFNSTNYLSMNAQKQKISVVIKWMCQGYIFDQNNQQFQQIQFIQLDLDILHTLKIRLTQSSTLTVYSDFLQTLAARVIYNGQFIPIDSNLAATYLSDTYNDMRTYVIGTYFKVLDSATKIAFDDEVTAKGIWIG